MLGRSSLSPWRDASAVQQVEKYRMNWKHKAAAFKLLGHVPFAHELHYFAQRHITKKLPRSFPAISRYSANFVAHLQAMQKHSSDPSLSSKTLFEFGAGWDLCSNIANYCFGINRQIVVDVRRLARSDAINNVIRYYQGNGIIGATRRPASLIVNPIEKDLEDKFGITYIAPQDAANTGLQDESVDFVVSTATLEHIPPDDIRGIMLECNRLCKQNSILSLIIDYADHYAKSDKSINAFHFLRYDDREWKAYNPEWHYQNRLRHCDYLSLFDETGFEIVEEHGFVKDGDLDLVKQSPLAPRFREYNPEQLAVTSGRVVLRKKVPQRTRVPTMVPERSGDGAARPGRT